MRDRIARKTSAVGRAESRWQIPLPRLPRHACASHIRILNLALRHAITARQAAGNTEDVAKSVEKTAGATAGEVS